MNIVAIERNQAGLKQLLTFLFMYINLADDTGHAARLLASPNGPGTCEALERIRRALPQPGDIRRRVHRMIVQLLIPMEAATRRLIIALAGTMPRPAFVPRAAKAVDVPMPLWCLNAAAHRASPPPVPRARTGVVPIPRFALLDPLKHFDRHEPEAFPAGGFVPMTLERGNEWMPDMGLLRRIAALTFALDDLPRQARRFARWNAERLAHRPEDNVRRLRRGMRHWPLRRLPPGMPPANLPKKAHRREHHILAEADDLAVYALRVDDS